MDREILKGLQYSWCDALHACAPLCPPVAIQPQPSACVTREVVVPAAEASLCHSIWNVLSALCRFRLSSKSSSRSLTGSASTRSTFKVCREASAHARAASSRAVGRGLGLPGSETQTFFPACTSPLRALSFCPQLQLLPEAAAGADGPKECRDPLRVALLLTPLSERHGSPAGQGLICLLCVLLQL